jgi:polyhydroxybutyrate depolymerase
MNASPGIGKQGRSWSLVLLMVALLLVVACGGGPSPQSIPPGNQGVTQVSPTAAQSVALQPGDTSRSLSFGGLQRTYLLHVPLGYSASTPTPLILAFHGLSLNAEEMVRISGLSEQADRSGFIVVYPNGTGQAQSWNSGHCCGEAAKNNVDDVGFVRVLIKEVSAIAAIDPKRIYATGFSNGAIFTYWLACELSDQIAAFGPVAATQMLDDQQACHPGRAVPVIHFHGTADRLNAYIGGQTAAGFEFVSVPDAIGFWKQNNSCPAQGQVTESGSITHEVYTPCAQNSAVELYTIVNGEHAWPGGEAVSAQVGEPTMEISASPLMWEFFNSHPMP